MEDVLDLYEEPHDPKRPVVCFDEVPYQMVAETRIPLPTKPGRPARYDYEYERRGTANPFAVFEPKANWRHLDVSDRRTAVDFAHQMRALVDEVRFVSKPEAGTIVHLEKALSFNSDSVVYRMQGSSQASTTRSG